MSAQKGNILLPLISAVAIIALIAAGYFFFQTQQPNQESSQNNPTPPPSAIPSASPKLSKPVLCNCSFVISSGTNVEFLVISPNGAQTGFNPATGTYVLNIPDSSYGVQPGLSDDTGVNPPMPDELYFGVSEAQNGIYALQIIGKQPGKYYLDVRIALGPGNGKVASIEGILTTNQVDKYTITIPNGTIQKVDN